MRKSQFVFVIMAAAYFVIAILHFGEWITVSENILLGLSISALLSALSDIFSNIVSIYAYRNEFDYTIKVTSDFLGTKISNNIFSPLIDVWSVKFNVESMSKGYKKAVHPNDYSEKKVIALDNILSQVFFVSSIAVFILSPFPLPLFQQSYSVLLTLFAFAAMCFNLFLEEIKADIAQKKNHFFNDTQLIIQMAYPDFMGFLNWCINHYEGYISVANKQEDKPNAHT